jgi:hypothetical protein
MSARTMAGSFHSCKGFAVASYLRQVIVPPHSSDEKTLPLARPPRLPHPAAQALEASRLVAEVDEAAVRTAAVDALP